VIGWLALLSAVSCDVAGTLLLRQADGFRSAVPSALAVASFVVSLPLFSVALRSIPVSTAYAVWSGLGTAAVTAIGIVAFKERATATRLIAIVLIVVGVAMLRGSGHETGVG
jgi:small multidrug resistance pump